MSWTIAKAGGAGADTVTMAVESTVITCRAGGNDRCRVRMAGAVDAPPLELVPDEEVVVTGPDAVAFRGIVVSPQARVTGSDEGLVWELAGKLSVLEEIVYTQRVSAAPAEGSTTPVYAWIPEVVLGLAEDGSQQTTAEAIMEVLTYANTQGAGLTIGTIALGGTATLMPLQSVQDWTCREALDQILSWHPDAVLFYDHAAGTVNVKLAGALPVVNRPSGGWTNTGHAVTSCTLTPTRRRVVRGVSITYNITREVDGGEYRDVVQDTAGALTGKRVVHMTVPLMGSRTEIQRQPITVETIPEAVEDVDITWLRKHFPALASIPLAGADSGPALRVETITQTVVDAAQKVGPGTIPARLPRALLTGSVQDWMAGVCAVPVRVVVEVSFIGAAVDYPAAYGLFTGTTKKLVLTWQTMGTTAVQKVYTKIVTGEGEVPPAGMALKYYQAMQTELATGGWSCVGEEPDAGVKVGQALALTGPPWDTSASPVLEVETDVGAGSVAVRFGSAGQALGPAQFVQLLRAAGRGLDRAPTYTATRRTDAAADAETGGAGGVQALPAANTERHVQGSVAWGDLGFAVSHGGPGKLRVARGDVLTTEWDTGMTSGPKFTNPTKRISVAAAELDGVGVVVLKLTFSGPTVVEPKGNLADIEEVTITGGSGGRGGHGGFGGSGGSGGMGGGGGKGGTGGSGGKGGKGGDAGDPTFGDPGYGTYGEPGEWGAPGYYGQSGDGGADGLPGMAPYPTEAEWAGGDAPAGFSGEPGLPPSSHTLSVPQAAQAKLRFWEVASAVVEVLGGTTPPVGNETTGYIWLATVSGGGAAALSIQQHHVGAVVVPGIWTWAWKEAAS